ncbi:MAG: sensor histidine kinase [Paracoccaceae bacterium]|nr:sensor histidine kinase [Paracoccaceae bacterium]
MEGAPIYDDTQVRDRTGDRTGAVEPDRSKEPGGDDSSGQQEPSKTAQPADLLHLLRELAPFSSLQRRIIFFNLIGLAILVIGVMYLNQFRSGLIELRVEALRTQGEIIAITIAESSAAGPGEPDYDPIRANVILNRLAQPTGVRARLYDRQLRLTGDTRNLAPAGAPIEITPLGPPGADRKNPILSTLERTYTDLIDMIRDRPPLYTEVATAGISRDREVREAALGNISHAVRVNSEGELIVSVAMPVRRFKAVLGVLVLSTQGEDINAIVQNERIVILQVFVIATIVSVALSVLLANTIANPIRRLSEAADQQGTNSSRPIGPDRVEMPDLTNRTDEIGDLSASLIRMTQALYRRIEAIEAFAADVAHELKNPLTSLRSAVETMVFAKTPEQKQQLLDVIEKDVQRLDRLVTDISNASRLDAELVRERMDAFDLSTLINALAEMIRDQAVERDVSVDVDLPSESLMPRGLEGRIAQVITNLMDNALSFSPDGSAISVKAERTEDGKVRVSVEDQGPGIPEDNVESIFERFYSERPTAESFGNHSGLGLSISKQIIEAHAGHIWAENIEPPEDAPRGAGPAGARFVLELPV